MLLSDIMVNSAPKSISVESTECFNKDAKKKEEVMTLLVHTMIKKLCTSLMDSVLI